MSTHNVDAPPARRRSAQRTTEQLKLNLSPEDALAIRSAAGLLDMTISGYIARLVAVGGDPSKLAQERNHFADASRIAAAVSQVPAEVRSLRSELGRLGGLVKSFFVREDSDPYLTARFDLECGQTLRDLQAAAKKTEEALEDLRERLATVQGSFEEAARALTGR